MITLILTVLCTGPVPLRTVYAETTKIDYEQDLQLVRMGWYDSYNERRCKAIRVQFSKT
jgi:hypothetical protein